ncbi:MAG: hypothetical protein ABSF52_07610 [Syntrophobacteraceae bacterium]
MKSLTLFTLVMVVLIMPCGLFAQQDQNQPPNAQYQPQMQPGHKHGEPNPQMMEHWKNVMAEHGQMMKEMDARLQEKVAAMDAAKGDQKIEAMAAVIKEMVAQRQEMRDQMMKMREMMTEQGHEHMGMGGTKSEKPPMPIQEDIPK